MKSKSIQPEALMQLADAYAEALFDQGLHRRSADNAENARSVLDAATPQPTQAAPVREHDLQDVRCEYCGYMTYHREHMGCIRATRAPADNKKKAHYELPQQTQLPNTRTD